MSLYNTMFGVDPTAGIALKMLNITHIDVPRFRDAFFAWSDEFKTEPVIVVYTRTGGGNRNDYQVENKKLTELNGYLHDHDDKFDSTFAEFFYSVPIDERDAVIAYLNANGEPATLQEKLDVVLQDLKKK